MRVWNGLCNGAFEMSLAACVEGLAAGSGELDS